MSLLLATLLALTPDAAAHDSNWLLWRMYQRRTERMMNRGRVTDRPQNIRLGRQIHTRTASPRRTRYVREVTVIDVIDGSLLHVRYPDGKLQVVRILGAEAPLIRSGSKKAQCYAREAKERLASFLIGETVALEESEKFRKDHRSRVLYYVRSGSRDVGAWMISNGHAFSDRKNGHERQARYNALEDEAKEIEIGLWSGFCDYTQNPRRFIRVLE